MFPGNITFWWPMFEYGMCPYNNFIFWAIYDYIWILQLQIFIKTIWTIIISNQVKSYNIYKFELKVKRHLYCWHVEKMQIKDKIKIALIEIKNSINNGKLSTVEVVIFYEQLKAFDGRNLHEEGIQIITSSVWNKI